MAGASTSAAASVTEVRDDDATPSKPHQPRKFAFPKKEYGKKTVVRRAFNPSWFDIHTWLDYDEAMDAVFCHVCKRGIREKGVKTTCSDVAFMSRGFCNWKDAKASFKRHEESRCHKDSVQAFAVQCLDCREMLSKAVSGEKSTNRQMLYKILSTIRCLARQGLPLRGDGTEINSNFMQIFLLQAESDPRILEWLKRKSNRYTSPDIQNEILLLMSNQLLREINADVHRATFYTIMVDETTDCSNREQAVLVLRYVDDKLYVHEEFIGLYNIPSTDASTIVMMIKDCLQRLNLSISKARGQCYDGASAMSGARSGVAKRITDLEKRAIYLHCYGHSLNLACVDTMKNSKILKDCLEVAYEITKLIKYSPKREGIFRSLKESISPDSVGIRVLCPTRWTVRAKSLDSIIVNYSVLQDAFEESKDCAPNTEMKCRIIGAIAQMKTFDFLYGAMLGELILRHCDNLSATLQSPQLSASEAQDITKLTVSTLEFIRRDAQFDMFWEKVLRMRASVDVQEPALPRQRKAPRRYEIGTGEPSFPDSPKDLYRKHYYEALDLVIQAIKSRFDQPGYSIYCNLQDVLIKAARGQEYVNELDTICDFYQDDLNKPHLQTQLLQLTAHFSSLGSKQKEVAFGDILEYLRSLSRSQLTIFSDVILVLELILVLPATNASSERSFSALRRIKTYLRSTMGQQRLNNLMSLHVHKDRTDSLSLVDLANDFVANKAEHRNSIFGKFSDVDKC